MMDDLQPVDQGKIPGPVKVEPPTYLFVSLAMIVALHLFLPGAKVISGPWTLLGIVPLVGGVVLNLMADRSIKQHKTSVKPLDATTTLVTTGAFRITRHPMYLGFVLILLGAAVLSGSVAPFLVVLAFFVFMDTVFIRFEEKKLAQAFGDAWSNYIVRVRRWI